MNGSGKTNPKNTGTNSPAPVVVDIAGLAFKLEPGKDYTYRITPEGLVLVDAPLAQPN